MTTYQPLTHDALSALKAGDVFFMLHSFRRVPIRCVIQENGTSVVGKDDAVSTTNCAAPFVKFEMPEMLNNMTEKPVLYGNRFFETADGVRDAWHQKDIASVKEIRDRSAEDTLLELFMGWRGENDRTTSEEQAMLDHLEVLFGIRVAYP